MWISFWEKKTQKWIESDTTVQNQNAFKEIGEAISWWFLPSFLPFSATNLKIRMKCLLGDENSAENVSFPLAWQKSSLL